MSLDVLVPLLVPAAALIIGQMINAGGRIVAARITAARQERSKKKEDKASSEE
ncbi:hypothetical protein [Saccharothrix longispora]|uniref:hypothetical protein n=1 Tax=Saccharothrix longispora TaxID=33920 RepID=UPI0028FD5FEC|nr:hypothetical protein [Saccharothrix longispora]MDU0292988.1 hypothetical protein [Saccharothrix longispora]